MFEILTIISLALLAGICFGAERSVLYPPFAMAASWTGLLFLHAFSRSLLPIQDETLVFFLSGVIAFCLGGYAVHFLGRHSRLERPAPKPNRVRLVLNILLTLLAIGLPYYWSYISSLVVDLSAGNVWSLLRQQLIEEQAEAIGQISAMNNLVVMANVTVLIAWYHRDTERWRAWLAFTFFIVYNLLTAGRAGFVSILMSLFVIDVMRLRRVPWRSIAVLGMVFVVAFFGLAILVGKAGASKTDSLGENAPALIEGLQLYTVGPIVAFDNMYQHPNLIPATQNIDRSFKILASKFGAREDVPFLHADYSTVTRTGMNINVYTAYFSYFPQLGTVGSLFMMALIGAFLTWAYFMADKGGPQAVILFAILFYGIPLSGYNENYFMNLNFLSKMFLLTLFCYGLSFRRSKAITEC